MKIYKSNLYGNLPEPESFEELVSLLTLAKDTDKIVHMWRGQSDIDWRIDHSAYRRLKNSNKNKITERDLIHYEKNLLKQATHKGYRFQEGRILTDFELLAKLQHHGAATRLLDFTRNALIAVWFCITKNITKTGLLIGLHAHYLGGYEGQNQDSEYETEIKSLKKILYPQTWEPPVVTPRIAAQHSQFIYSALADDPRSSITLSVNNDANVFIAISPKLKSELEYLLEITFDLRFQTLFPDIDGFSNANSHEIIETKMWRW